MGKCMSAVSDQDSGAANTDNLIEPDELENTKEEEIKNKVDTNKKVNNTRSLSESDDDETEPLEVDKKQEDNDNNNNNNNIPPQLQYVPNIIQTNYPLNKPHIEGLVVPRIE
eukprot:82600_1